MVLLSTANSGEQGGYFGARPWRMVLEPSGSHILSNPQGLADHLLSMV